MNRRELGIGIGASLALPTLAQAQTLTTTRRDAQKPPAKYLIAVLHGYGSDGADMFTLVPSLEVYAPTAAFTVPNAPVRMDGGGYSWMSERERGLPPHQATEAAAKLNAFLDAELARLKLGPDKLILFGFSQGSNMSLNVGLRRATPPAAIIAFAGARLSPIGLRNDARKVPVLLAHGSLDDRLGPNDQANAIHAMSTIGITADAHIIPRLPHSINEQEIRLAGALLRKVTGA